MSYKYLIRKDYVLNASLKKLNSNELIPLEKIEVETQPNETTPIIVSKNTIGRMISDAQMNGAVNRGKEIISATQTNPNLDIIAEAKVNERYEGAGITIDGVLYQKTQHPFNNGDYFVSQINDTNGTPITANGFQFANGKLEQRTFESELFLNLKAVEDLVLQLNDSKANKTEVIDTAMQNEFEPGSLPTKNMHPVHKEYVDTKDILAKTERDAIETRVAALENGGQGTVLITAIDQVMPQGQNHFSVDGKLQLLTNGLGNDGNPHNFDFTLGADIEWIEFFNTQELNSKVAATIGEQHPDAIQIGSHPYVGFTINVGGEIQLVDTNPNANARITDFSSIGVGRYRQQVFISTHDLATKQDVSGKQDKTSQAVEKATGNANIEGSIISIATKLKGLFTLEEFEFTQELLGINFKENSEVQYGDQNNTPNYFGINNSGKWSVDIHINGTKLIPDVDYTFDLNLNTTAINTIRILKDFGFDDNEMQEISYKGYNGTKIALSNQQPDNVGEQEIETTTGIEKVKDNTEGFISKDKFYEIRDELANKSGDNFENPQLTDGDYMIHFVGGVGQLVRQNPYIADNGQEANGNNPREVEWNSYDGLGKATIFVYDNTADQFVGVGMGAANNKHILIGNRKDFGAMTIEVDTATGATRIVEHFDREVSVADFTSYTWTDGDESRLIDITFADGEEIKNLPLHHHTGWGTDHITFRANSWSRWSHSEPIAYKYDSSASTTQVDRRTWISGAGNDGTTTISKVIFKGGFTYEQ